MPRILRKADAGSASFETTNIGTLRAQGVEADFTAIPALGLSRGGAVAFNDAVFEDNVGASCYFLEPTGTSGLRYPWTIDFGGPVRFAADENGASISRCTGFMPAPVQ